MLLPADSVSLRSGIEISFVRKPRLHRSLRLASKFDRASEERTSKKNSLGIPSVSFFVDFAAIDLANGGSLLRGRAIASRTTAASSTERASGPTQSSVRE